MNKGKSNYNFQSKVEAEKIRQVIEAWLTANGFAKQDKFGEEAYYMYDKLYGNRGFQYTMENDMVYISAWIIGKKDEAYSLEIGKKNEIWVNSYRDLLGRLFDKMNEVNNGVVNGGTEQASITNSFTKENEALEALLARAKEAIANGMVNHELVSNLREIAQYINLNYHTTRSKYRRALIELRKALDIG